MGIDVNLYAEGEVSDDELAAANALFAERSQLDGDEGVYWQRDKYSDTPRVERNTLARFYGPHYERGPWPDIYADILLARVAFPNCKIHYGGDSDLDSPEATDETLADTWAWWLGPHGAPSQPGPLTANDVAEGCSTSSAHSVAGGDQ